MKIRGGNGSQPSHSNATFIQGGNFTSGNILMWGCKGSYTTV